MPGLDGIKYYPNPANNTLTIEFETPLNETSSYRLYDLQGKTIITGELHEGRNIYHINISSVPNGFFIIQI